MENASKALIIAGAILISIVLIGVGVLIVGNAQGIFDQAGTQMSQLEIQSFNEPFMSYKGKQSGSNVRSLAQKIATHNATYDAEDEKQISFVLDGTDKGKITMNDLSELEKGIGVGSTFSVTFTYHEGSAIIEKVNVEKNK